MSGRTTVSVDIQTQISEGREKIRYKLIHSNPRQTVLPFYKEIVQDSIVTTAEPGYKQTPSQESHQNNEQYSLPRPKLPTV